MNKVVSSIVIEAIAIKSLPHRLVRVVDEQYSSSSSLGPPGVNDVFVSNPAALKGLNAKGIAEKLTLQNADGTLRRGPFRLIEFDTPAKGLTQPFNRSNPGFINGGKTAGGVTEYVMPNAKINTLMNVIQKTVK